MFDAGLGDTPMVGSPMGTRPEPSLLIASPFTGGTNFSDIFRLSVPPASAWPRVKAALLPFPYFVADGSFDGIMRADSKDLDGSAFVRPNFIAADRAGGVFLAHRNHNKIMRIATLTGQVCNASLAANSPEHPCRPGTWIDWTPPATCRPCGERASRDVFAFSSYCEDENGAFNRGKDSPQSAAAAGTAAQAALATAVGVISAGFVLAAAVTVIFLRQRRALEALKRRPSSGEAVEVLVSTINLARRESARGGLSLQAARAVEESGGVSAEGGSGGGGGGVSTLAFSDLVPEPHVAPLFGGFGVVFAARWVSRGLRVAVKVPKDLVVSGYLPPAAATELIKEAQVSAAPHALRPIVPPQQRLDSLTLARAPTCPPYLLAGPRACLGQPRERVCRAALRRGAGRRWSGLGRSQRARSRAALRQAGRLIRGPERGRELEPQRRSGRRRCGRSRGRLLPARPRHGLRGWRHAGRGAAAAAGEPARSLANGHVRPPARGARACAGSEPPAPRRHRARRPQARERACLSERSRVAQAWPHSHCYDLVLALVPQVLLSGGAERHVRLADFGLSDLRGAADAAALAQSRVSTAVQTDKKRGTWRVRTRAQDRSPTRARAGPFAPACEGRLPARCLRSP